MFWISRTDIFRGPGGGFLFPLKGCLKGGFCGKRLGGGFDRGKVREDGLRMA